MYPSCFLSNPQSTASLSLEPAHLTIQLRSVSPHAYTCSCHAFSLNTFFAFPNCTNSVKDFKNAEKLLWRFNLQFGSFFLFIFRLSVSHGADNSAVMAAAAVVSMGKWSIVFVMADLTAGEECWKAVFKLLQLMSVFFYSVFVNLKTFLSLFLWITDLLFFLSDRNPPQLTSTFNVVFVRQKALLGECFRSITRVDSAYNGFREIFLSRYH